MDEISSNRQRFQMKYSDEALVSGPRLETPHVQNRYNVVELNQSKPFSDNSLSASGFGGAEDDLSEDYDFSDSVLRYINQILMQEEDVEDKTHMLQESLELQAKERSLYEALGKRYPPSLEQNGETNMQNGDSPEDFMLGNYYGSDYHVLDLPTPNVSYSSVSLLESRSDVLDGFIDSPVSSFRISDIYSERQSIWNFRKGVEEASKFLPRGNGLLSPQEMEGEAVEVAVKREITNKGDATATGSRGMKNLPSGDLELEEERSNKQAAVYTESTLRSEEFDIILLHSVGKGEEELKAYRTRLQDATRKKVQKNKPAKGGTAGAKGRSRKPKGKKQVVDLRTLLMNCAQAVAADDRKNANELLRQIRQHSFPFGDGNQRLAHCLADGLEARLAGIGSQLYKALVNKRTTAADYLKAYHLYLASCPFRKISNFASNRTIMIKAANAMRVHVIDFGILYGFQFPTLIQRIIERDSAPPRLRITGIEFPQPGFRPAERIEETGRRLADYAQTFNVPFEYNPIAKAWETIRLEDLKFEKDEFVVVNCLYRFNNLHDETVAVESSRTTVLNLIRKISPDLFIHGVVNGAYSAPFFVTRFREAMFHFSSLFDMLDTNVPRDIPERMLIERDIFGREAMNVIACEGWERVERPETYKQWQVRHLRAGFTQIPFEREIMNKATDKVRSGYHKDFVIDEDGKWLLLGWKGRTVYALSCWMPT